MIFVLLMAAVTGILTFALQLLPGDDFLALPDLMYTAVGTAAGWAGWALSLSGTAVKDTVLTIVPLVIGLKLTIFLWKILTHWRPPMVKNKSV